MIIKLLSIVVLIHAGRSQPQLLTYKNGKIGVNFGGYHAEAGLGGLLTGNAAHGGLSASAGTPYGQIAGAGLGGSVDGKTAGGLYAGASAGQGVGASAAIGGGVANEGGHGGAMAESHAGSVSRKVVKLTGTQPESVNTVTYVDQVPPNVGATYSSGFSAGSTFNAQSSLNGGANSQSSIGSTNYAQSSLGSVDNSAPIDTAPQEVYVQKFKKRIHHHIRPSHQKVLTIEKHVQVPQFETNTHSQTHTNFHSQWGQQQQPGAGFDFRKYFDFGLFANTAAGFGGAPQQSHQIKTIESTVPQQPQVSYEQRVVPKVVYEKRIVPQVIVEKKIVPETILVEKTVQPSPVAPTFTKEVKVEKRIETNAAGNIGATQNTYVGGDSQANFGYSGNFNHQAGSNLFDAIFNIPIATLQAVNRLVSNTAAGAHANIDIQKSVTVG